ncbi:CoA-binding protein [Euzebya tangerina]|uniref:CoA-binding protein n=1 Tax=Euzebya tangerina TaxID=591198 RepID=UPI000E31356F|nr:CoA-binding protein [Euzebya tangerina]
MAHADPKTVLESASVVAVVGLSTKPYKAAHQIPADLQRRGFEILPVHPTADEILGVPAVPLLADLEAQPDLVVVFRPPSEAAEVTRQAIQVGAEAVWLQLGITSDEAEALADEADIDFVQDHCSMVEARRYGITK